MFATFFSYIAAFFIVIFILASIRIVRQAEEAIVERFGKFARVLTPGLNFVIPVIERIAVLMPMRIMQLRVDVETKTSDNVFVRIPVSIQYRVTDSYKAYYTLYDYESQIRSYVFDCVRTITAQLELDRAFEAKEIIANSIEDTLKDKLESYGFNIIGALVTDIEPDEKVRQSMNEINAAQRQREAAIALAEAEKIKIVKQAEGEAESKRLQGVGVANQRNAIVEGLVTQYKMMNEAGCQENVQEILLMTQYFDTLAEISRNSQTKTIMIPSNPGGFAGTLEELRNALYVNSDYAADDYVANNPLYKEHVKQQAQAQAQQK